MWRFVGGDDAVRRVSLTSASPHTPTSVPRPTEWRIEVPAGVTLLEPFVCPECGLSDREREHDREPVSGRIGQNGFQIAS
jgi:hypothetical protein